MKQLDHTLTPAGAIILPGVPHPENPVAPKETVNLNSLIAAAVKQTAPAAGCIILRMDELPEITANPVQMQEAFGLLFRCMLTQIPATGKIYCYVKGVSIGPTLLDEKDGERAYCVEIHSNAQDFASGTEHGLVQQATALFLNNKIGFEHKKVPSSGVLFSLTIYDCTNPAGNNAVR